MAKYSALTAVGTFIILNPKKAQAFSPSDPGGNPLGREMENLNFPFLLREMENFD